MEFCLMIKPLIFIFVSACNHQYSLFDKFIFLADIDTYVMELLKYVASKNGVPHVHTSALMVDEIPEKQFHLNNQQVENGDSSFFI